MEGQLTHAIKYAGAAIAALIAGTGAGRALEAGDVWRNLQELGALDGITVTANTEETADGLALSDVTYSVDDDGMRADVTFSQMRFVDRDDGTVAIVLPESQPMEVATSGPDIGALKARMTLAASGLDMVASEVEDGVAYDYTAPEVSLTLEDAVVEGDPVDASGSLTMSDVSSRQTLANAAEIATNTLDLQIGSVALAGETTQPDGPGEATLEIELGALASTGEWRVPTGPQTEDIGPALEAGLRTVSETMLEGMTVSSRVIESDDRVQSVSAEAQSLSVSSRLSAEGARYRFEQIEPSLTGSGQDIPPGESTVSAERIAAEVAGPVTPSDEAADLTLSLAVEALNSGDSIWSFADPQGELPHEPSTLIVDLAARGRWTEPLLGRDVMTSFDQPPGEIESLTINELRLSTLGAEVTGEGEFTFDNTDTETFPGVPRPVGMVEFVATGVTGMIDQLVAAGVAPDQAANGARMMLGLVARPGEGEDTLVSEIEFTEDGQLLANGTPIR